MFKMKKEAFDIRVKDLTMSQVDLFKSEQVNELIEKLEHLRLTFNDR